MNSFLRAVLIFLLLVVAFFLLGVLFWLYRCHCCGRQKSGEASSAPLNGGNRAAAASAGEISAVSGAQRRV